MTLQVYNNFASYQFSEYVKLKGKLVSSLTEIEKETLKKSMMGDLYPG
jgi:hypothetical protein